MPAQVEIDAQRVNIKEITLDVTTITLGEMAEIERESGRSMDGLLKGRATQLLVALWLADHRKNSGTPRSWQELCDLRVFAS
jgi:hypothetical protein